MIEGWLDNLDVSLGGPLWETQIGPSVAIAYMFLDVLARESRTTADSDQNEPESD